MNFWQVCRIIRGYRNRDKLKHQLIAECVYAATYCMRGSEGKTVKDMFPSLFEDDDDIEYEPALTDEEVNELQELMKNINSKGTE